MHGIESNGLEEFAPLDGGQHPDLGSPEIEFDFGYGEHPADVDDTIADHPLMKDIESGADGVMTVPNASDLDDEVLAPGRVSEIDEPRQSDTGHISSEQEACARGDHQLPDEPNRGFTIERLGRSHSEPTPIDRALPTTSVSRASGFARMCLDGTLDLDIVEDAWTGVQWGKPGFVVYFPVKASEYHQAVDAGVVEDGLFSTDGKVMHTEPGADALDQLVDAHTKQEALEAYYSKQEKTAPRAYIDDIDGIEQPETLSEITEAYELSDGGRDVRLLNFSSTPLSDEQLRQAVNNVRSVSDRSGGAVLERLHTIAILPRDHPSLQVPVRQRDGTTTMVRRNGYQAPNLLALSEWLLYPVDQQPPPSTEVINFSNGHLLPGEPKEGPGSPKRTVSGGRWEVTLAHELTHMALDKEQHTASLPGPAPTLYGRSKVIEHVAELGAAEYIGGEDAMAVPDDQRQAYQELWRRLRAGDKTTESKQPQGPRFVVCRELDLSNGLLPLRPRYPGQPLPIEVTYRLVDDAQHPQP